MIPVPPIQPPKAPKVAPQDVENPDHDRKVEEAREDREAVERRPFLHYLAQIVPGLLPGTLSDEALAAADAAGAVAGLVLDVDTDKGADASRAWESWFQQQPHPGLQPLVPPDMGVAVDDAPAVRMRPGLEVPAIPGLVRAEIVRAQPGEVPATTLRFQLAPEHLGKLDLSFTYAQQKVSVTIVAQSQAAREQLAEKLGQIRDILHQHRLQADKVEIAVEGRSRSGGARQDADLGAGGAGGRLPRRRLRKPTAEGEDITIS
ncbi:MAG: flagellar hook-length control protein FliK [Candidatus Sericytochromatia bacterium]|nr:flagellar hook-length control protein FliK [Candidatus Sericytochromatia bacterium]